MGPSHRREREKELLRRRILDASRVLFAEKGYEAVNMRTIAEAIEYSPRTIYLHFKDKEELIRELCTEDFQSFGERLGQLATLPDPLERLQAIGLAYAQFGAEFPHHYKLMFMTPPAPAPEVCSVGKKVSPEADAYAVLRMTLEEAMTRGMLRPELTDLDVISQVIWSGMHGVVALVITHQHDPWVLWTPVSARVETMIDVLVRGIRR